MTIRAKPNFYDSSMCKQRKKCESCRVHRDFREAIAETFDVPSIDFPCPYGIVAEEFENDYATAFDQLFNITAAISRQVEAKLKGERTKVSDAVQAKRWALCQECNYYNGRDKCLKCRCSNLKRKTTWATERCPLGKWLRENNDALQDV